MSQFRFENLEIWQRAVTLADRMFDAADACEQKRLYRFAEQLRGAALSVSNNIAEGSGSESNQEFKQFLNYARRSVFEVANMVYIFARRNLLSGEQRDTFIAELAELSRMITAFRRKL